MEPVLMTGFIMGRLKKKQLKIVYEFDPSILSWQERLDSAFDLVFKKMAEMELKGYGENIQTQQT